MKCAANNHCIQRDDINPILDKIRAADALILGTFHTFASVSQGSLPYYSEFAILELYR